MNISHIDEVADLRSDVGFQDTLARALRKVIDEAIETAREIQDLMADSQQQTTDQRWNCMVAKQILNELFVRVSCLSTETEILCRCCEIRELRDAIGDPIWPEYDGVDSAVLFVDLMPSANWAHPSLAVLFSPSPLEFHDLRPLWYPIEPSQAGTEFRTIFDLPKSKLGN